jgi:hypothetical protein
MRTMLVDAALVLGGSFAAALLVKATLVLAVALLAHQLARQSRAAVRHVLLAAAFAVLLVLPVAASLIPSRAVEVQRSACRSNDRRRHRSVHARYGAITC